jgi:O-antigen biosynthesis protein
MPDHNSHVSVEFDPLFGTGGNIPATQEDIENCYNLILGRYPESVEIISEALGQPVHSIIKDMISSKEFSDVVQPLLSGRNLRHSYLGKKPDDSMLFWLNERIFLDKEFSREVLSARTWEDILQLLLSRLEISVLVHMQANAGLTQSIQNQSDYKIGIEPADVICFLDECSMARVQGWATYRDSADKIVTLNVIMDGELYTEFECNLPRPDLKAAGYSTVSGFKLQLPRRYFDGKKHTIGFVVDGRQVNFHIKGQLYSEHMFEEFWVPPLRSNVDGFDRGVIRGWALRSTADNDQLKGGLTIKVTYKEETVATLKANRFRPDVSQALGADPYCGFLFDPPYQLRRSSPLAFHFYDAMDGSELANSPCSTSFGMDHRQGKLLALQDTLERLSSELFTIKQDLKSLISRRHHNINDYDMWFRTYVTALRNKISRTRNGAIPTRLPTVSVICPTFKPELKDFKAAVESIMSQTYQNWELIIVDDGSDDPALSAYIEGTAKTDPRVRFFKTPHNLGISGATNLAIDAARGEWTALFDHDDLLVDVALEIMMLEALKRGAKILYSDEDKIDSNGYYSEPALKPDWNYRLLLSCNYVCHFLLVRTELIRKVGKLRSKYDGAQDHDLILRLSEIIDEREIVHVPEVLYHWRKAAKSTASEISVKSYAIDAGINAVSDHLARKNKAASVTAILKVTMYCVRWEIKEEPLVHIIIPFRDEAAVTSRCLDAVLGLTKYRNFRITLVDNWSNKQETMEMLQRYAADQRVNVVRIEEEFNYSRLNNIAAKLVDSEFIFLMNNDLVVLNAEWLNVVVNESLADPSVGAVGGKFLYPNGSVQHAGVILGLWGVAGHVHAGLAADAPGYAARAILAQELSAVTAAGMLVRADVFRQVGQFDEVNLKIAFNDIDLCLRIREAGYKIIWTPSFVAEHHESLSRGQDDRLVKRARFEEEVNYMRERWGKELKSDPHYSVFFDSYGEPFFDLVGAEQ